MRVSPLNYSVNEPFQLSNQIFEQNDLQLWIKPEYQNHPVVSGNKWWKLKYNLLEAQQQKKATLLTFGGAYSNHIRAVAAAAKELGMKSIGIIRGEERLPLNHVLSFASGCGMHLHFVSREAYRRKDDQEFFDELRSTFEEFYLIPEGGTNQLAVKGCAEWAEKLINEIDFDYMCVPIGTGGTIAGLICGLNGQKKVLGFSSLKGGDFLSDEVEKLVRDFSGKDYTNWKIQTDYHFGGYAKGATDLDQFISDFKRAYEVQLDFVYNGKTAFGLLDMIKKGYFERGSRILMIHTGGIV